MTPQSLKWLPKFRRNSINTRKMTSELFFLHADDSVIIHKNTI